MKIVLQRVKEASVSVDGTLISEIGSGILLLVGVAKGDTEADADWLAEKIAGIRVLANDEGKMNFSVRETGGEVLAVSQFTLLADTRRGKRPSFANAASPAEAQSLFDYFCKRLCAAGILGVKTGTFGAIMDVALINDGPVTLVLER